MEKSLQKALKNEDFSKKKPILSVVDLKQYFRFGSGEYKYNKAVHGISFDIYEGEVLGLVGESGCGKTTTGRALVGLYEPTSGSIYFDGIRISAGTRWNEKEIKWKTIYYRGQIKELKEKKRESLRDFSCNDEEIEKEAREALKKKFDSLIANNKEELNRIKKQQWGEIKKARFDNAHHNDSFAQKARQEVKEKHKKNLEALSIKKASVFSFLKEEFCFLKSLYFASKQKITSQIQMVFQDPLASLDPRMTVREIIIEGLRIQGIRNRSLIDSKVKKALESVGLTEDMMNRYPHEFSGGQRQRIGIARALIMEPRLLICDEPVSALDVSIQAQVINLLSELKKKLNLSMLFIAHDLSVVKYFCDRIAVMYFGRIVEVASSDELFRHPLHPYTRSLLSAIPFPDPRYEKKRKRIDYVPSRDHHYQKGDMPLLQEVKKGHFVLCDKNELSIYKKELHLKGDSHERKKSKNRGIQKKRD